MRRISLLLLSLTAFSSSFGFAKDGVRYLELDDSTIGSIRIHPGGTVISFPVKPTKVILGKNDSFAVEYIANDIALAPLARGAASNLFVYLLGQRYSFSIRVTSNGGDKLILIRDPKEKSYQVELK